MAAFPGFPPEALQFLAELRENNDRDWFEAHKATYRKALREPLVELVLQVGDELEKLAPGFQTDPKKCIYRIHRDIRFSPNKQPYKTHFAASFSSKALEKHAGAAFYFHASSEELLVGGGVYMPGSKELLAIRRKLQAETDRYRSIIGARTFKQYFGEPVGEKLKRPPKGFDADDPAIELLKSKQWLAAERLPPKLIETPRLLPEIVKRFRAIAPFLLFLNEPLLEG